MVNDFFNEMMRGGEDETEEVKVVGENDDDSCEERTYKISSKTNYMSTD